MARAQLNRVTGKGAPPILLIFADEGEPGFDYVILSESKAKAILECLDEIREFANEGTGNNPSRP